jgi:alkylated DNA repair protein alkB family protein 8
MLEEATQAKVYNDIAEHFHQTRHALWPGVLEFLQEIPAQSTILDLGCGNGKYLSVRADDCVIHGCDTCDPLLDIARGIHPHAHLINADARCLPYKDATFDAVISIAVLHHLDTDGRQRAISEIMRVLKPNGRFLITVWAMEAIKPKWTHMGNNDYVVPWYNKITNTNHERHYHIYTEEEATQLIPNTTISWERDNWYIKR